MFIGVLVLFILIILLMLSYITIMTHRLYLITQIKNKRVAWLLSFIPAIIFIVLFIIDRINTAIVLVYLVIFSLVCELLLYIFKKILKKELKQGISFVMAIVITFIYLVHGYFLAHHVVETRYEVKKTKDIGVDNFRITQISDSHIGATMDGNDFIHYMEEVNNTNPDIVVVTGDFVDDDTSFDDMIKGCIGLGNLKTKYGVYFIYGNHDKGYFTYRKFDDEVLRKELKRNNVIIMEDDVIKITDEIYLIGRKDKSTSERVSAETLTKNMDKSKYIIALDHEPNDYVNEAKAGIDLVLCGHTHGGQLFPLGQFGVKLGINDSFYGMEKRDNTTFIVNSGLGDWAIKFKTGTVSEYTVIDIK